MKYEWDDKKEATNIKKHRVSFKEAKEAINCGAVSVLKEENVHEERYIFLGMCKKMNILVVVVTYPGETITRIISARKATKKERLFYEKEL